MRIETLVHASVPTIPVALFLLGVIFNSDSNRHKRAANRMEVSCDLSPNCGFHASHRKPYIRSALGRAMYDKIKMDQMMEKFNKTLWYQCDISLLAADPSLQSAYLQLKCDKETVDFLDSCRDKSDWLPTQIYHSVAKFVLGLFLTQTTVNGFLNRGSMFVFSRKQFHSLLPMFLQDDDLVLDHLLDLGAGDGAVTRVMAADFRNVDVTEISPTMRWQLRDKGFNVLDIEDWIDSEYQYDVISCLNLLDRCDKPLTLLRNMWRKLVTGPRPGKLILALVLPFKPYVETGSKNHLPGETMDIRGSTLEEQVSSLVKNVLYPEGWEVEKWTRVPYLCEGDFHQSYYWLDDVVLVLNRRTDSECPDWNNVVTIV